MSEKRFSWKIEKLQHLDDEVIIVVDNANKEWKGHILNIVDKLNELYGEMKRFGEHNYKLEQYNLHYLKENTRLKEENDRLRQMIKENVFQRYNEGSLADLEFKAIAYDDIIKVKLSDESGLKVIVYCKQGKKENVKSFCQMFIPFGVAYEIKEVIDDE